METKFYKVLSNLMKLNKNDVLQMTSLDVSKQYKCSTTCANYAIQAYKFIITEKFNCKII